MQQRVCECRMNRVDELKLRLIDVWNTLQQNVIDAAISDWRKQMRACVHADGQHFEHLLRVRVTNKSYGQIKYKYLKNLRTLLYCWTCDFWGLKFSQGKVHTISRWGGISNHLLMAYLLSNISTKNYWNWTTIVEIIVGDLVVSFFWDTVCKLFQNSQILEQLQVNFIYFDRMICNYRMVIVRMHMHLRICISFRTRTRFCLCIMAVVTSCH